MGRRKIAFILMLLICSIMPITSSAIQEFLPTESNYQQKTSRDGVTGHVGRRYSASAIRVSNRIGHGSAAGGGGGGGGENGGGSRGHTGGGGTAVIPIYAAGSSQAHHSQGRPHNAGNRYENSMGLLVAAVLAAIAYLHSVF